MDRQNLEISVCSVGPRRVLRSGAVLGILIFLVMNVTACERGDGPGGLPLEDAEVRACRTAILFDRARSDVAGTRIGPLFLQLLANDFPSEGVELLVDEENERYRVVKISTLVEGQDAVALAVHPTDKKRAALVYRGSRTDGAYRIDEGSQVVIFEPCEDSEVTGFNGGIVVADDACTTLEVYRLDPEPEWVAQASIGRNC